MIGRSADLTKNHSPSVRTARPRLRLGLVVPLCLILVSYPRLKRAIPLLVYNEEGMIIWQQPNQQQSLFHQNSSSTTTTATQHPDFACLDRIQEQLAQKQLEWREERIPLMTSIIPRPHKQVVTSLFNILIIKGKTKTSDWWDPHMTSWMCLVDKDENETQQHQQQQQREAGRRIKATRTKTPSYVPAVSIDHMTDPHNKRLLYVTCPWGTRRIQAKKYTHRSYWNRFQKSWLQGRDIIHTHNYEVPTGTGTMPTTATATASHDTNGNCLEWGITQLPPSSPIMLCTQLKAVGPTWELAIEHIAFHHLIGVDQFYIYINERLESNNTTTRSPHDALRAAAQASGFRLPERLLTHHVHFVPFQEYLQTRRNIFQATVLNDCLIRARDAHVPWVLMNDVDEYFQIMNETYRSSLPQLLHAVLQQNETVDALTVEHWKFGANLRQNESAFPPKSRLRMEHYHWRQLTPRGRQKLLVRPERVPSVHIHTPWREKKDIAKFGRLNIRMLDARTEIRMVHYFRPQSKRQADEVVFDDSLEREYATKMRALLLWGDNATGT